MKKDYEKPTIEIIEFEIEDTITASGLFFGEDGTSEYLGWGLIE